MATVTDTATGSVYQGVSGSLLDYYRGEGERFVIVDDDADLSVTFPQVWENGEQVNSADSTASGEQSGGDGTNGGDPSASPFVLPDGQYLASDGVVYDQASSLAVDPQPSAEDLARLAPPQHT